MLARGGRQAEAVQRGSRSSRSSQRREGGREGGTGRDETERAPREGGREGGGGGGEGGSCALNAEGTSYNIRTGLLSTHSAVRRHRPRGLPNRTGTSPCSELQLCDLLPNTDLKASMSPATRVM